MASLEVLACATTVAPPQIGATQRVKAARIQYFIEIDGYVSIEPHPGPRDAAFRIALDHGKDATHLRVIAVEGEHPLSEAAKRSIYEYDPHERRWTLVGG